MRFKLIKIIALVFVTLFSISVFATALPTYAADGGSDTTSICDEANIPDSVKAASGCKGNGGNELKSVIGRILNSIIAVSSLVAVIFIIVGGVQYMTSGGDSGKTKKAKDTILYAVIGLIVCALAFAIVNFTISLMDGPSNHNDEKSCTSAGYKWDSKEKKCT